MLANAGVVVNNPIGGNPSAVVGGSNVVNQYVRVINAFISQLGLGKVDITTLPTNAIQNQLGASNTVLTFYTSESNVNWIVTNAVSVGFAASNIWIFVNGGSNILTVDNGSTLTQNSDGSGSKVILTNRGEVLWEQMNHFGTGTNDVIVLGHYFPSANLAGSLNAQVTNAQLFVTNGVVVGAVSLAEPTSNGIFTNTGTVYSNVAMSVTFAKANDSSPPLLSTANPFIVITGLNGAIPSVTLPTTAQPSNIFTVVNATTNGSPVGIAINNADVGAGTCVNGIIIDGNGGNHTYFPVPPQNIFSVICLSQSNFALVKGPKDIQFGADGKFYYSTFQGRTNFWTQWPY